MTLAVSYDDVTEALPHVHAELKPTPLVYWPGLSELVDCQFYLKHENCQPVGAFKIRGGINLLRSLSPAERAAGIWGVSTGNHGQSLAFAAARFGVPCSIVVPEGNNPAKNRAIRQWGATLIEHGRDFDAAREHLEQLVQDRGGRYVHSANEPKLIAGVGTMACEIFQELPVPDAILVPIGLGSGVCGTAIVAKHLRPQTRIIGVQAENAAAIARAWQTGIMQSTDSADTWAEGLATRVPAEMTMNIMRELLDDVLLVSDDDLRQGVYHILQHTHHLAEGAGAASVAAAYKYRARFRGQKLVGILSGGNLDISQLPRILSMAEAHN